MDRDRKLWWLALTLAVLVPVPFLADVYSGHIDRSGSVIIVAGALLVAAMGVDLWRRTAPSARAPLTQPPKHPVLLNALFVATLLALGSGLVYLIFLGPESNWRHNLRTIAVCLLAFVTYNLLLTLIRYVRIRRHNLTNS